MSLILITANFRGTSCTQSMTQWADSIGTSKSNFRRLCIAAKAEGKSDQEVIDYIIERVKSSTRRPSSRDDFKASKNEDAFYYEHKKVIDSFLYKRAFNAE